MRQYLPAFKTVFVLTLLLFIMTRNGPAQHPDVAGPETDGYVRGELIYPLDDRPVPRCHASTVVQRRNGNLMAAWFGGSGEGAKDTGILVSRHDGEDWNDPEVVVRGNELQETDYPCWNPILFRPEEGPLMLFYKVGPGPDRWWGCLVTSEDGGRTWSRPRKLGTHPKLGKPNTNLIGPVKNKPLQLKDGSLLSGSSSEHRGWRVHFERMKRNENGRWEVVEVIGPIHDAERFDAIQPAFLRHGDGRLQVLCRTRQNVIATSRSRDRGESWNKFEKSGLPNPNSGVDAVTLDDGRHLLVYNHTRHGRSVLNVALSENGRDWDPVLTLEKQEGEYSYPAVIQTADGRVHCTYTYRRRSVRHVVLNPDRLK